LVEPSRREKRETTFGPNGGGGSLSAVDRLRCSPGVRLRQRPGEALRAFAELVDEPELRFPLVGASTDLSIVLFQRLP